MMRESNDLDVLPLRPEAPEPAPSPTLAARGRALPAYELKFLLPAEQAAALEELLRERLAPDPHADPALGGAYRVQSLYFDTLAFDVFHQHDGHRRRKHRLRRYGMEPTVFFERKAKRAGRVRKRRVGVPVPQAATLLATPPEGWEGAWFTSQLAARRLRPACRLAYDRTAFVGTGPHGPIRATLDRRLRGAPAVGLNLEPFTDGWPLLAGAVVVEFKHLVAPPALFKELIEKLRLTPGGVSKYRQCMAAGGLAGAAPARDEERAHA